MAGTLEEVMRCAVEVMPCNKNFLALRIPTVFIRMRINTYVLINQYERLEQARGIKYTGKKRPLICRMKHKKLGKMRGSCGKTVVNHTCAGGKLIMAESN